MEGGVNPYRRDGGEAESMIDLLSQLHSPFLGEKRKNLYRCLCNLEHSGVKEPQYDAHEWMPSCSSWPIINIPIPEQMQLTGPV